MLEILIDDRKGNIFDISELVTDITVTTRRAGRPGEANITLIPGAAVEPGYVVRIRYDVWPVFYGYVFTVSASPGKITLDAYDQTRYLLSRGTYVFTAKKASQIVQAIAAEQGIRVGKIEDTAHVIPSIIEDDQAILDIIQHAIEDTTQATGKLYVFGDIFGSIELWRPENKIYETAITDDTIIISYDSQRSIDRDTYNRVVIYRDNDETGRRDIWTAQDSATIAKWGRLTLTKKVDKKLNEAQIKQILDTLIKLKNRETKTTMLRALGLPGLRAGMLTRVVLNYEGTLLDNVYLTEEVRHKITGGAHTTEIKIAIPPKG